MSNQLNFMEINGDARSEAESRGSSVKHHKLRQRKGRKPATETRAS